MKTPLPYGRGSMSSQWSRDRKGAESWNAATLGGGASRDSVGVDDEFCGGSLIEVFVASRGIVERDELRVDGLRGMHFVVQDGHHELAIVAQHRALAGVEGA